MFESFFMSHLISICQIFSPKVQNNLYRKKFIDYFLNFSQIPTLASKKLSFMESLALIAVSIFKNLIPEYLLIALLVIPGVV